jgi:hypothetical protein
MKDVLKKNSLKKLPRQPAAAAEHHEQAAPAVGQPVIAETPAAHPDDADLSRLPRLAVGLAVDQSDLLSSVASYIRRFLVCDDHQLTILALWTLYTWCYNYFPTAAYLDVHSPGPQSGKSRCLKVLYGLCYQPDLIAGADSRTARHRLLRPCRTVEQIAAGKKTGPHTFLFDDCHLALNTSERQPLLALLNSGTGISNYSVLSEDYMVFGPKAFAASLPLPHSLASRCFPIKLHRKKPSEKANYFALGMHRVATQNQDNDSAFQLPSSLERWAESNREELRQANGDAITDLPEGLSPAQQDCAAPLLRVADRIGGPWPQKARTAVATLLDLPQFEPALQLLADIRNCFLTNNNPDQLSTRDLLAWLINLDDRPWTTGTTMPVWNSNSGRRLRALLKPYKISSHSLYEAPQQTFKGYWRSDFHDIWERYLPPLLAPGTPGANLRVAVEAATDALNQSVSNPSAPNCSEINATDGMTE